MNIGDKDFQKEATHIPMSHLVMENGKPIFQGTLWSCITAIRNNEAEMTRSVEHSPFTIMPAPKGATGEFIKINPCMRITFVIHMLNKPTTHHYEIKSRLL